MRLIDADLLKQATKAPDTNGLTVFIEKVLCGLIDRQPTVDAEPKWIPCSERLPEIGQVVLASGKKSVTTGQFKGTGSKPCYWWWKGNTIKIVYAWMPLPEPYKMDGKEQNDDRI